MKNIFKAYRLMSKAKKSKMKRGGYIGLLLTWGATSFALAWMLKEPINQMFEGKPELAWGLTSTSIALLLILIIILIARRATRPMREKRKLRKLETTKVEREIEKLEEADKVELEASNDKG